MALENGKRNVVMTAEVDVKKVTETVNFQGQIALVTGAGKGLGRASALALAEAGAKVIAVSRTETDLRDLQSKYPSRIEYWTEDVLKDGFYSRLEKLEQLDIFVACAGGNKPIPITDLSLGDIDWLLDLNIRAIFRGTQSATRVMLKSNSGSIVIMSSQMGHVGAPNRTLYCTTKHAVEGLTKALAVELAPKGIRVNSVAPTFVDTPMQRESLKNKEFRNTVLNNIALGQLGTLEDVAAAVLFLSSSKATMITGHSMKIDGGWTAW